jgi:hypothetical protein
LFLGYSALALGAKKAAPKTSLGTLVSLRICGLTYFTLRREHKVLDCGFVVKWQQL